MVTEVSLLALVTHNIAIIHPPGVGIGKHGYMRTSAFHRKSIAAEQEEYLLSLRRAPLSGKPAQVFVSDRLREECINSVGGWLVVCKRKLLQPGWIGQLG